MIDIKIPDELQQMFDDSKLDTTTFVGSDIRSLIMRIAKAESRADKLSAELDKGDSWAWIRSKFEKAGRNYRWFKPREWTHRESLVGTRYEVMGWLHCLFGEADTARTAWEICIEQQKRAEDAEKEIEQWKTWGMVEVAVRNPNVHSYMEHWEGRALKAENELTELHKNFAQSIEARSKEL